MSVIIGKMAILHVLREWLCVVNAGPYVFDINSPEGVLQVLDAPHFWVRDGSNYAAVAAYLEGVERALPEVFIGMHDAAAKAAGTGCVHFTHLVLVSGGFSGEEINALLTGRARDDEELNGRALAVLRKFLSECFSTQTGQAYLEDYSPWALRGRGRGSGLKL